MIQWAMLARVFLILLLACVRLSLQDASQIVACHETERHSFFAYRNVTSGQFVTDTRLPYNLCNAESLGRLCRSTYKGLFYATDMSATVLIEKNVPWYRSKNGTESTEMVRAKQFECKATPGAVDFPEREGSWTDKLQSVSCLTRAMWEVEGERECGGKPTDYALGGQCEDPRKYLQMTFVCDIPMRVHPQHEMSETLAQLKQDYGNQAQFLLLKSYAETSEKLMQADQNDEALITKLTRKMASLSSSISHLVVMEMSVQPYYLGTSGLIIYGDVLSRRALLQERERNMGMLTMGRKILLFNMALRLLSSKIQGNAYGSGESIDVDQHALKNYNVEEFFAKNDHILGPFPENRAELREYYIEYCKNNTLGIAAEHLDFLSQPNAHIRIIEMYEEIFNPGLINPKYLPKPASVWIYVCLIVALLGLVASGVVCYSRIDRNFSISSVVYSRFGKSTDHNGDKNGILSV